MVRWLVGGTRARAPPGGLLRASGTGTSLSQLLYSWAGGGGGWRALSPSLAPCEVGDVLLGNLQNSRWEPCMPLLSKGVRMQHLPKCYFGSSKGLSTDWCRQAINIVISWNFFSICVHFKSSQPQMLVICRLLSFLQKQEKTLLGSHISMTSVSQQSSACFSCSNKVVSSQ